MNEIKELKMKYFVLKLDECINAIKLKNKLLTYISEELTHELRADKLALMILNSIKEED